MIKYLCKHKDGEEFHLYAKDQEEAESKLEEGDEIIQEIEELD